MQRYRLDVTRVIHHVNEAELFAREVSFRTGSRTEVMRRDVREAGLNARPLGKTHTLELNGPCEDGRFPPQEEAGPRECRYVVFDRPAHAVSSHELRFFRRQFKQH